MIGPHMIVNGRETQPKLYEHALELYLRSKNTSEERIAALLTAADELFAE